MRSGTFKTVIPGLEGREQVSGFQLAGDVLGLDGLAHGRHASRAVALEDSEVVVLPYGGDARGDPRKLVEVLPRLIGRELVRKQKLAVLLSCMSAEQRLASFLLNLSRRLEARGYSATEFHLRMTRSEIGSYLGLNLETVSRTLSSLHHRGLVEVSGRHVLLRNRPALAHFFDEPPPPGAPRLPESCSMPDTAAPLERALQQAYRHGFVTDIESDALPPGLDEDTVRAISRRKREPDFLFSGGWPPSRAGRP